MQTNQIQLLRPLSFQELALKVTPKVGRTICKAAANGVAAQRRERSEPIKLLVKHLAPTMIKSKARVVSVHSTNQTNVVQRIANCSNTRGIDLVRSL